MSLQEEQYRVGPVCRVTRRGRTALAALGFEDPVDLLSFDRGQIVRRTPLRQTLAVEGPGGERYFLKRYAPGAGRVGRIHRRRAPAEVEWDNLAALVAAGLPVPEACCAVWSAAGDRGASALLLRAVPGAVALDTRVSARALGDDSWLLARLVPLVRRLHAAGFQHRDLYACHLLVETGEEEELTLIDLARVRRREPLPVRWRVKDLAALEFSLAPLLRAPLRLRLFLAYLGRVTLDRESRRLLLRVRRKSARIAAHAPRYG